MAHPSPGGEAWREAPGFPGYEVSSHGRVRGSRGILAQHADANGYMTVRLQLGGHRRTVRVHMLVALAFLPPRPFPGAQVRHLRQQWRNHADALAWGTQADNERDKREARRRRAGRRDLERRETRSERGNDADRVEPQPQVSPNWRLSPGQTPVTPQDETGTATGPATGLEAGCG